MTKLRCVWCEKKTPVGHVDCPYCRGPLKRGKGDGPAYRCSVVDAGRPENRSDLAFADLTAQQKRIVCHGCGGKGGKIPVPKMIFHANGNFYDFGYWKGGTERDRLDCDAAFFGAMVRDAARLPFRKRGWYLVTSWIYFRAVRCFAREFFSYGPQKKSSDLPSGNGGSYYLERGS